MSSVPSFLPVDSNQLLKDTTGIFLDYFAVGFSDHPIKFPYTLEALAGTIIQVIEHKGCSSCHFVGHSFGGALAIQVAFQRPDIVKSLLMAEGNLIKGGGAGSRNITSKKNRFCTHCFP